MDSSPKKEDFLKSTNRKFDKIVDSFVTPVFFPTTTIKFANLQEERKKSQNIN